MTDRTKEFRTCVEEKRSLYPPDPKAKGKSRRDVGSNDADVQSGRITAKAYLQEAYIIVSTQTLPLHSFTQALTRSNQLKHINTLSRMLTLIRRPYLNISDNEFLALRQTARAFDLGGDEEALASLKYMSNQERDQVDLQAKTILSRCVERVKEMEQIEQSTQHVVSSLTPAF
jgi:syntaxin 18